MIHYLEEFEEHVVQMRWDIRDVDGLFDAAGYERRGNEPVKLCTRTFTIHKSDQCARVWSQHSQRASPFI